MIGKFLELDLYVLLMVFLRMGTVMMLMPGIGDAYVLPRMRLILALLVTFIVAPVAARSLPPMPKEPLGLLVIGGGEILVGVFIGTVVRAMLSALTTAGTIISTMMGLTNIFVFDPVSQQQGALLGKLLNLTAIFLIFHSDTHHLIFRAALDSYTLFVPGHMPPIGDFLELVTRVSGDSFRLAFQLSAPFFVVTTVLNIVMGILSKLLPQMQVYFVTQPALIVGGLYGLAVCLSAMMLLFMSEFQAVLGTFVTPR